jgi:hypothetical protein
VELDVGHPILLVPGGGVGSTEPPKSGGAGFAGAGAGKTEVVGDSAERLRNGSDAELRYLNFHAPGGGFADYLRGVAGGFDSEDPPEDGGRPSAEALIVSVEDGPVLADRPEIRVEALDEHEPASDRLTCLYALDGGRLLQIQA